MTTSIMHWTLYRVVLQTLQIWELRYCIEAQSLIGGRGGPLYP